MERLKYIPILLLLAFGVKYLIVGIDLAGVACLASLGIVSFCLEKFLENNNILALKKVQEAQLQVMNKQADELEQVKSYVSGLRLNSMNGMRNGINRPAQ